MQAFLTGGFWAILIGGGALVVASVTTEAPVAGQPPALPETEIAAAVAPEASPDAPVTDLPLPQLDETPAAELAAPEPAPAPEAVIEPDVAASALRDAPLAVAPQAPAISDIPPAPVIVSEELVAPAATGDLPGVVAQDTPVVPPRAVVAPAQPAQDQEARILTTPAPAPDQSLPEIAVVQDEPAAPAPSIDMPQIEADAETAAPEVQSAPAPLEEAPTALPQSASSVRVNRPGAAPVADAAPVEPEMSPLSRYAADFDYAADLPMMAVILRDNAMIMDAPAVLSGLPFVPTIVLNASAPDVAARMRAYRDAGIEVLLQADLPVGAQPSDLETTYSAAFRLVPEAIALFSDGTGPEVSDRALADQALQVIAAEGRGFVTLPRGLGGALRNVATDGVPMANIARELDGAGESADAIERSLQQAALRARQSGNVILLGSATPDTLAAIRNWAQNSDPAQISLAPVSAILLQQMAE